MTAIAFSGDLVDMDKDNGKKNVFFKRALIGSIALHILVFVQAAPGFSTSGQAPAGPLTVTLMAKAADALTMRATTTEKLQERVTPERKRVEVPARVAQATAPVLTAKASTVAVSSQPVATLPVVAPEPVAAQPAAQAGAISGSGNAQAGNGFGVGAGAGTGTGSKGLAAEETDALKAYRNAIMRELGRNKRYPEEARRAGLTGQVAIKLTVANGTPDVALARSSSVAALDTMGVEMVKIASGKVPVPEVLRNKTFDLNAPIQFELL